MRIGIVGAGFIGEAVARLGTASGHEVMISNSHGADSLAALATGIGCRAGTVEQAEEFGEVVVVAIPLQAYRSVPAGPAAGKVVIDTDNYYPERDGRIAALDDHAATTSGLLAAHLPASTVIKAFNAILATDLGVDGRPSGTPGRRALPIAGDDAGGKAMVAGLLDQFGYDAVDAGLLSESWRFERAMPCYCVPLDRVGLVAALAAAERGVEVQNGSWRPEPVA